MYIAITPYQQRQLGEALDRVFRGRGMIQVVHTTRQWADAVRRHAGAEEQQQEPTKKPRHHDHLIQRHIRSPIRK